MGLQMYKYNFMEILTGFLSNDGSRCVVNDLERVTLFFPTDGIISAEHDKLKQVKICCFP
jgi:hypothetical protein